MSSLPIKGREALVLMYHAMMARASDDVVWPGAGAEKAEWFFRAPHPHATTSRWRGWRRTYLMLT
jgi:hypothetical protein